MEKRWRLILEGENNGYYNMFADEAIFLYFSYYKIPTLRIYGWDSPFVTLGCHQSEEEVLTFKTNIPFTKRITGGASILHYREVTYSIVCLRDDLDLPFGVKDSYKILCSFLIEFYNQLGLEAKFAEDSKGRVCLRYETFCYSTLQSFDITIEGKKIGGNAQRRRRNLIFQHGSIPQEIDFFLIKKTIKNVKNEDKITSLNILLGEKSDFKYLCNILISSFQSIFKVNLTKGGFFDKEKEFIKERQNQCLKFAKKISDEKSRMA
jgi:lipoate-protein ligase A